MNVFDWFADIPVYFQDKSANVVEVSFKNGARKGYFRNNQHFDLVRGDLVVVETAQGTDTGEVTIQGELVKLQLKKKGIKDRSDTIRNIIRVATERDIDLLEDLRDREHEMMVKARVIAREFNLEMKLGDVEMQGDGSKATFYYTADDRVDFRELVKRYAKDFKCKIEMRQIGARQEAARIGGIGSCGRELCCSSWLNDFKTVNTTAARYQNISINTDKLSGQCGRLKCCLNYELDAYIEANNEFPKDISKLETSEGVARLMKTEILTRMLWFRFEGGEKIYKLKLEVAKEILQMNKKGIKPESLVEYQEEEEVSIEENKYEELVGHVNLSALEKNDRRNRNPKSKGNQGDNRTRGNAPKRADAQVAQSSPANKPRQKQRPDSNQPNQKRDNNTQSPLS